MPRKDGVKERVMRKLAEKIGPAPVARDFHKFELSIDLTMDVLNEIYSDENRNTY